MRFLRGGTKGKTQRSRPISRAQKSPRRISRYLVFSMRVKWNHRTVFFSANGGSQTAAKPSYKFFSKHTLISYFLRFLIEGT